jgi:hypothetical protein
MGSLETNQTSVKGDGEFFKLLELQNELINRIINPHTEHVGLSKEAKRNQDVYWYLTVGQFLRTVNKKLYKIVNVPYKYSSRMVIHNLHDLSNRLSEDPDSVYSDLDVYNFIATHASYSWLRKFKHYKIFIESVANHLLCTEIDSNGIKLLSEMSSNGHIKIEALCYNALLANVIVAAKHTTKVLTKTDFNSIISYDVVMFEAIILNLPPASLAKCKEAHQWVVINHKVDDIYHEILIKAGIEVTTNSYDVAVRVAYDQNAMFMAKRLKQIGKLPEFTSTLQNVISYDQINNMIELSKIFGVTIEQLIIDVFMLRSPSFISEFIQRINYRLTHNQILLLIARYKPLDEFHAAVDGIGIQISARDQFKIITEAKQNVDIFDFTREIEFMSDRSDIDNLAVNIEKEVTLKKFLEYSDKSVDKNPSVVNVVGNNEIDGFTGIDDFDGITDFNGMDYDEIEEELIKHSGYLSSISEEIEGTFSRTPSPCNKFLHRDF